MYIQGPIKSEIIVNKYWGHTNNLQGLIHKWLDCYAIQGSIQKQLGCIQDKAIQKIYSEIILTKIMAAYIICIQGAKKD